MHGDLNDDGIIDVLDIDTIAHALQIGDMGLDFDLNKDRQVTAADHEFIITDILKTWIGDSNLDGEFNTGDLVKVFQAGEYEDGIDGNSTWSTGDWNGDGEFTSVDFIVSFQDGGFERGPRVIALAVPEPKPLFLLLIGAAIIGISRHVQFKAVTNNQKGRGIGRPFYLAAFVLTGIHGATQQQSAMADIFRWDNHELISGTEGLTPGPEAQFDNRNLVFADLQSIDLHKVSLEHSNLANASFQQSVLTEASLRHTNLTNGNFIGATLSNADFTDSIVTGARFPGGHNGRSISMEQLYSTESYKTKSLQRILLSSRHDGWDLSGQDLTGADLGGGFRRANFEGAILFGSDFSAFSDLTDANLRNSDLRHAVFVTGGSRHQSASQLTGADLSGANLKNAAFFNGQPGRATEQIETIHSAIFSADTVYNQWTLFPSSFDPEIAALTYVESPLGDFDANDETDIGDLNLLADVVRGNFNWQGWWTESLFDVNHDGNLDLGDYDSWIVDIAQTWRGDANLDGDFNSGDLVAVFQGGEYEDDIVGNSSWATGDWNADGEFDTGDLVAAFQDGGYERGPRVIVNAVPEPTSSVLLAGFVLVVMSANRRQVRR